MLTSNWTSRTALVLGILVLACGTPSNSETAASPVVGMSRSAETLAGASGVSYDRRADDGVVIARMAAVPALVWDALGRAFTARKVALSILDRPSGRMGDTALVMMRQWNGQPLSRYLSCGSTMTGQRADVDRIRAVMMGQLTKLVGDTIAVAIHLSASASPLASGNSGSTAQCVSTGRAEAELLDEMIRQLGGTRRQQ